MIRRGVLYDGYAPHGCDRDGDVYREGCGACESVRKIYDEIEARAENARSRIPPETKCAGAEAALAASFLSPVISQKKRSVQVPDQPCPWCGVSCGGCDVDVVPTESGAEVWSGTHEEAAKGCRGFLRLWVSPQGFVGPLERDRSRLTSQPQV